MNSLKIMIFLWQFGIIDSLTLLQFCINCGAQYTGLTFGQAAGHMGDIGPSVLLAPVKGLGTGYKYVQAAQGAMEKRARIATLASFMAMSGRATLTDPATNASAGGTLASFIGHMKSVIEKSKTNGTGGLVFVNPASKYTNDELIALRVVIVGGVLLIIISYYVLPRIAKVYGNYSKKLMDELISKRKKHSSKLKEQKRRNQSKLILKQAQFIVCYLIRTEAIYPNRAIPAFPIN